jgi:thiamine biosynthesis protein ThiS
LLVQINGEPREVDEPRTLSDLVNELSLAPARIAVELNQQVVRRDKWDQTTLAEDDRIEIVHFVGGGSAGKFFEEVAKEPGNGPVDNRPCEGAPAR